MRKILNGVVLDDDLFLEYHKFQKGEKFDKKKSDSYFITSKKK